MDKKYIRWIHASVREFIKQKKAAALSQIKLFNEADIRDTNKSTEHLELRIDGPYERKIGTRSEFYADLEINILINTTYHENQIFRHQDNMGLAANLLEETIQIYKIGDQADDQSLFGILTRIEDPIISNFGQIDPTVQVQQASVEAHYTFEEC